MTVTSLKQPEATGTFPSNIRAKRLELPTWSLGVGIYLGWFALTYFWRSIPLWLLVPAGAWLIAWHGSLQHEAIHGHPTRVRWINALFAGPPLSLWLPFEIYRSSHLAHHRTRSLTDPLDDPESYYVSRESWSRMGHVRRAWHWALATLAGRLVLGPLAVIVRFAFAEIRVPRKGNRAHVGVWLRHAIACALVLGWVVGVCAMPAWVYLLAIVYPGMALTLVRSFAEHRPAGNLSERSAIVETGPVFSLLFLNNNLHAVHHVAPNLPWYELPERYRATRERVLAENGAFFFAGYTDVARRFGLRPKDAPAHPGA